jgi:hypothetical protein
VPSDATTANDLIKADWDRSSTRFWPANAPSIDDWKKAAHRLHPRFRHLSETRPQ